MHVDKLAEVCNDLEATVRYIHDEITEHADSLDFDEALDLRDAINLVIAEARTAGSFLEAQMLVHLEAGAQQRGTRLFARKRVRVQRFAHDAIRAHIGRWARLRATDDNGEISIARAVDNAMEAMADLYLAPSTKAKVTRLTEYEIDTGAVSTWEDKGWALHVDDLDQREG